jgi:hypothetical protein
METFEITLPYKTVCKELFKEKWTAKIENGDTYELVAVCKKGDRCTVIFERV